jgi:hypothetical protein
VGLGLRLGWRDGLERAVTGACLTLVQSGPLLNVPDNG